MKKIALFVIAAFVLAAAAPVFAGPFSDVKPGHWAYEAVSKLAAKGIIEGYPDGKFKGGKALTRYEMAMIVARLIERGVGGGDLEKLTVEFADELALLGIKVTALEDEVRVIRNDVDALKAGGLDGGKVKMNYDLRMRWEGVQNTGLNAGVAKTARDASNFSTRVRTNMFVPSIDENVSAMFALEYEDDWCLATPNNPTATLGGAGVNDFTALGLYLGYVDIKNFGHFADTRIGRQTVTLGYGMLLDDQIDGFTFKRNYRGTNFGLGAYNLGAFALTNRAFIAPAAAANTNQGLNFKTFTVDRAWRDIAAGLYYGGLDRVEVATTTGNTTFTGLHVDGKLGKNLVATLEYASTDDEELTDAVANPALVESNNTGYKFGLDWAINKDWDLAVWDLYRGMNFVQLPINDDYSDSAFYGPTAYNFTWSKAGAVDATENYLNSTAMSIVLGYNAMKNLRLDLWMETLAGDKICVAGTTQDHVYDQAATQLVGTYQYRDNTAFKLRYRTIAYDDADADYIVTPMADRTEVRLDMVVKF